MKYRKIRQERKRIDNREYGEKKSEDGRGGGREKTERGRRDSRQGKKEEVLQGDSKGATHR